MRVTNLETASVITRVDTQMGKFGEDSETVGHVPTVCPGYGELHCDLWGAHGAGADRP